MDNQEQQKNPQDDFCVIYMRQQLATLPPDDQAAGASGSGCSAPWVSSWSDSFSHKFMHYQLDPALIDLDDPLLKSRFHADVLRKFRKKKPGKKKAAVADDFVVSKEGLTDVLNTEPGVVDGSSDECGDFLDEFGHIKEDQRTFKNHQVNNNAVDESPPKKAIKAEALSAAACKNSGLGTKEKAKKHQSSARSTVAAESLAKPGWKDLDQSTNGPRRQETFGANLLTQLRPKWAVTSCLTLAEQKMYLDILRRLQSAECSAQPRIHEAAFLNQMNYRIQEEQKHFQQLAMDEFFSQTINKLSSLCPDVKKYVSECYGQKLDKVKRRHRFYRPLEGDAKNKAFRLVPFATDQKKDQRRRALFELRLHRHLLSLGAIGRVRMPKCKEILWGRLRIPYTYGALSCSCPVQAQNKKPPVSSDPNAERLAETYSPDVVITSNALKRIFVNFGPHYSDAWILPVRVKCHGGGGKKVVYVDSALPPSSMTALDQRLYHAKVGSKALFVADDAGRETLPSVGENLFEHSPDLCSLETFGQLDGNVSDDSQRSSCERKRVGSEAEAAAASETRRAPRPKDQPPQTADSSFLMNILSAQSSMLERSAAAAATSQDHGSAKPQKATVINSSSFVEFRDNVSYHLWNLNEKERSSGALSLLVRSTSHAATNGDPLILSVKPEYQATVGCCQVMSLSELATEWMGSLLNGRSKLLRVRLDLLLGHVIHLETKSFAELTTACHAAGLQLSVMLGLVHTVLQELCQANLSEGQYLVQHDAHSGAFVRVWQADADGGSRPSESTWDLHQMYACSRPKDKERAAVNYLPCDFSLITAMHTNPEMLCVPGLFRPKAM